MSAPLGSSRIDPLVRRVEAELWHRPDNNLAPLDGLRGFASCIVVFYHCAVFTGFLDLRNPRAQDAEWLRILANGFWSGIDIFFVLSGFLIGRILFRDLESNGRLYYKSFLLRRSFRIFPAYYLVLSISLFLIAPLDIPVFRFLFLTGDWSELAGVAWSNYLYVVNYVRPGNQASPMSWAWSLCVEEHFYLLLPVLLFFFYRMRSPSWRLGALLACIALPFAGRALQFHLDPTIQLMEGFYYFSHNRFDELFVGVVLSYLYVRHRSQLESFAKESGRGLSLVGFCCVAAVWMFGGLQRDGQFPVVWQFLVMALGTGLILLNCLFLDNRVTRFFAHAVWYPLARVSYGTYLMHPFVLFGLLALYLRRGDLDQLSSASVVVLFVLVMTISTLVASAMFVVLEAPLLRRGMDVSMRSRARTDARKRRLDVASP